jgi:uncharacterized membrane protein
MILYRLGANRACQFSGQPLLVASLACFILGLFHPSVTSAESDKTRQTRDLAAEAQGTFFVIGQQSESRVGNEPETSRQARQGLPKRLVRWVGRFHVVVVHFPIALLIAAAVGELGLMWRRVLVPQPLVRFCVLLGAAGAVSAAGLGWLHAFGGAGADLPQVLFLHRWLGTVVGAWALGTALLSEVDVHSGKRSRRFRFMLFLGALLVGVVGHLGGTLVYGEDYFKW